MNRILLVTLSLVNFAAQAAPIKLTAQGDNPVQFEAVGRPAMLKIIGKGASAVGEIEVEAQKMVGKFKVSLKGFETGIALRDQHMRDKYLDVEKFPEAIFEIQKVELPKEWVFDKPAVQGAAFRGLMTLKGVQKEIQGEISIGDDLKSVARFEIDLDSFPIGVPSYLGATVAKTVKVTVSLNSLRRTP